MSDVKLVISEAKYGFDDGQGNGEVGTQRALVGVATNDNEALKLIIQDHLTITSDNGVNPFEKPVEKISEDQYKLSGEPMTWKVVTMPLNEVINQEL